MAAPKTLDATIPTLPGVLQAMRNAPRHTYQSLTKAAPQLLKYVDRLPPNLWGGVSSPPDWFMGKRLSHSRGEQSQSIDDDQ